MAHFKKTVDNSDAVDHFLAGTLPHWGTRERASEMVVGDLPMMRAGQVRMAVHEYNSGHYDSI